jgi:phosphoglycolate phosphatase
MPWRERSFRAVLFDLDGTLIDTAGDIGRALNRTLAEVGAATVPAEVVPTLIGRGASVLMERALARGHLHPDREVRDVMLKRFLEHYGWLQERGESEAVAYPGAAAALATLAAAGLRLAVVTNKPRHLAERALELVGMRAFVGPVVGGDTCAQRKPHPEPLLHACTLLGVDPTDALMVGDSSNDVVAARAAGMRIVCVPYGYNEGAQPRDLACDDIVEQLSDLPALVIGAGMGGAPAGAGTRA